MTWAGHITTEHNTSLTLTYNFAISGSTVDNTIIAGFAPNIPSVTDQMATWMTNLKDHPDYAPWNSENALFLVWVGINDVGNSFSQTGIQTTLVRDLDRLFEHVNALWNSGARNFAFLNVPRTLASFPLVPCFHNSTLLTKFVCVYQATDTRPKI